GYTAPEHNPAALSYKDQDQLLLSLLISSLSENVIPPFIGLNTFLEVWSALESAFASPSNTRVLHPHMKMQRPKEPDESVSIFLQRIKAHADELPAIGRPVSFVDFNINIFKGLKSNFKDLVTTLSARSDSVSYYELLSLLLSHE
ncbi:UBN2 domain-containing protein, partial [Cephalotus follicularis]